MKRYTLANLRQERHEALMAALAMYRREQATDLRNPQRMEWTLARIYWTGRAFHWHGEIMERLAAHDAAHALFVEVTHGGMAALFGPAWDDEQDDEREGTVD